MHLRFHPAPASALAAILAQMPTVEAKKLTESLAERSDNAKQALKTAEQAPAATAPTQSSDPLATPASAPKAKHARSRKLASVRAQGPTAKPADLLSPVAKPAPAPMTATAAAATQKAATPLPPAKS